MTETWESWPLAPSIAVLALAAGVLVVAGSRFTRVVDRLADRTGIGEALAGAVLLGATTSLPGLVVTVVAAAGGEAELAVANALGGIAAQTMFLAVADLLYPRANLEHAAASLPNLLQTLVLIALISLVLLAAAGPDASALGVHPASVLLVLGYAYGLRLTKRTRDAPMWRPRSTPKTRRDVPDEEARHESALRLWGSFLALGAVVAVCGFAVARAGISVSRETGMSETLVGTIITSVVTSLPELVTVIAAVRAGALTLAVGDIIGGNTFDVLFLAAGDVAYRGGSLYAAIGTAPVFLCALTLLLTSLLAAGLVYREESGIGFEGRTILVAYAAGVVVLALLG